MAHIQETRVTGVKAIMILVTNYLTARSRVILRNLIAPHLVKNTLHCTELEISLMCSQQFTTCPCLEPDKPNQRLSLLFL